MISSEPLVTHEQKGHPDDRGCAEKSFAQIINYRLKSLHLYSLQRLRERYTIMYAWILEDTVLNLITEENLSHFAAIWQALHSPSDLESHLPARVLSLREGSFSVQVANLFNVPPQSIRDISDVGVPAFKERLDQFLSIIPNESLCQAYTDIRQPESNSLTHVELVFGPLCSYAVKYKSRSKNQDTP